MVLEAGVGVNNQNWALNSTLAYYRFKNPIELKLELTFDCEHQHRPLTPYLKSINVSLEQLPEFIIAMSFIAKSKELKFTRDGVFSYEY